MNNKTEQSVTDVLPCPFCGSTEGFYVEEGSTFRWRVISCRSCGEGTEVRHKNNSDEPDIYIADWNAAAPYPAMLRKEIDNLRADLDRAIVNFGDAAATVCDMRTQLAEAQRELIAAESERDGLRASRIAYASEFPLNADGEPDVGNIHANIRLLKAQLAEAQRDSERLDWMIEQFAYVVSDPDCCDGYWLNYARPDGTMWTQATEHETPRAAIDAAKGESNA